MAVKYYNVTVDGNLYQVAVEETTGGISPAAPAVPVAPVVSAPAAAPAASTASESSTPAQSVAPAVSSAPGAGTPINAPLNGNILSVNVAVGDTVKKGQVLCIIEAMKMENEIVSPSDGKITSVMAQKGSTVNASDPLFTIA